MATAPVQPSANPTRVMRVVIPKWPVAVPTFMPRPAVICKTEVSCDGAPDGTGQLHNL